MTAGLSGTLLVSVLVISLGCTLVKAVVVFNSGWCTGLGHYHLPFSSTTTTTTIIIIIIIIIIIRLLSDKIWSVRENAAKAIITAYTNPVTTTIIGAFIFKYLNDNIKAALSDTNEKRPPSFIPPIMASMMMSNSSNNTSSSIISGGMASTVSNSKWRSGGWGCCIDCIASGNHHHHYDYHHH